MSRVDFDEPKLGEMQEFLNYIYTIGTQNSNVEINRSLVYRELCKYGLEKDEIDEYGNQINYSNLFPKWQQRNKEVGNDKKGLTVLHDKGWPHFLQFFSSKDYDFFQKNPEFIKLYIPIKCDGIYNSVNTLFDYLKEFDISHLSKVSDKIRSDNVIIRLDKSDIESAIKIMNFINNDNVIKNSLNKTNPFVPTINGIGFMYEKGISYNEEMATLISKYINYCINYQIKPSISDFYKWFKGNNYDYEVDRIFSYAIGERKYIETDEKKDLTEFEKYRLFIGAIKATFLKYDMNQVMFALKSLLEDNDYSSFTNGNGEVKYRNELRKNVTRDEVIKFIENMLPENMELNFYSIKNFCQKIFKEELLKDFCEACIITSNNYGIDHLNSALNIMINENNPERFSRYSKDDTYHAKNYRRIVVEDGSNGIINLMKLFFDLKGLDYENLNTDELIHSFTENLNSLFNEDENDNSLRR